MLKTKKKIKVVDISVDDVVIHAVDREPQQVDIEQQQVDIEPQQVDIEPQQVVKDDSPKTPIETEF